MRKSGLQKKFMAPPAPTPANLDLTLYLSCEDFTNWNMAQQGFNKSNYYSKLTSLLATQDFIDTYNGLVKIMKTSDEAYFSLLIFGKMVYCATSYGQDISSGVNKKILPNLQSMYNSWFQANIPPTPVIPVFPPTPANLDTSLYMNCSDFVNYMMTPFTFTDKQAYYTELKGYFNSVQFTTYYTGITDKYSLALLQFGKVVVCAQADGVNLYPDANSINGGYVSTMVDNYNDWAATNVPFVIPRGYVNDRKWALIFYSVILVLVLMLLFFFLYRKKANK